MVKNIKYFVFILILLVGFILIQKYFGQQDAKAKEYMENLNFKFSGIVMDKKELYSYRGIFYIDVKSSTTQYYDVRESEDFYYAVIKNGKAEILETMDVADVGDSIVVDGFKGKTIVYRNKRIIKEIDIVVTTFDPFYNSIQKLHQL